MIMEKGLVNASQGIIALADSGGFVFVERRSGELDLSGPLVEDREQTAEKYINAVRYIWENIDR